MQILFLLMRLVQEMACRIKKPLLSPSDRLKLIDQLIKANLPGIEVASFVNPKAVPAMEGAHEIMQGLIRH